MDILGIDISKDFFHADLSCVGLGVQQFENQLTGFQRLLDLLPETCAVCLEATGYYSQRLAYFLAAAGIRVILANPLKANRFMDAMGKKAKTDKADARALSRYGAVCEEPLWQGQAVESQQLNQKRTVYQQFKEIKTALTNQLHAFSFAQTPDEASRNRLATVLATLETELRALETEMDDLLTQVVGSETLAEVEKIRGVSLKTIREVLIVTGCFERFSDSKQVSSYLGRCPSVKESGTSVRGKGTIRSQGKAKAKRNLYLAAMSAVRFNPEMKAYYTKLRSGAQPKPAKVALIAVAHKLLRQIFAIVKYKRKYDPAYAKKLQKKFAL